MQVHIAWVSGRSTPSRLGNETPRTTQISSRMTNTMRRSVSFAHPLKVELDDNTADEDTELLGKRSRSSRASNRSFQWDLETQCLNYLVLCYCCTFYWLRSHHDGRRKLLKQFLSVPWPQCFLILIYRLINNVHNNAHDNDAYFLVVLLIKVFNFKSRWPRCRQSHSASSHVTWNVAEAF